MKKTAFSFIILSVIVLFYSINSFAEHIRVNPGENIQDAIDSAGSSGSVYINSGQYIINSPLEINGYNDFELGAAQGTRIFIMSFSDPVIEIEDSSGITLYGISAGHINPQDNECLVTVILISNSSNILITGCDLHGSGTSGIEGSIVEGITIEYNIIHNNSWCAVSLFHANHVNIYGNIMYNNENGFYFDNIGSLNIYGNQMISNPPYYQYVEEHYDEYYEYD